MTDTTPAALERIMERLRGWEPLRVSPHVTQTEMSAVEQPVLAMPSLLTEAAAVIAALGVERGDNTAFNLCAQRCNTLEARLREIAGIADSTIRAHTSGSDACHRIQTIARTVGEKDNG